jgi:hypothetical protein
MVPATASEGLEMTVPSRLPAALSMGVSERGRSTSPQSAEAGAVSLLCSWLQRRQTVIGEAFQSFPVRPTRTPATVEPMMLIEKLSEELLGGRFGGAMGESPDFLALLLETNPIGRVPLVDGRWRLRRRRIPVRPDIGLTNEHRFVSVPNNDIPHIRPGVY